MVIVTGNGRKDNAETIIVLAHIIQKNNIINLIACFCVLVLLLKIILRLIRKFNPPETILANSVANATLHIMLEGKKQVKIVNKSRSTRVQPMEAVANFRGVL